MTPPTSEPGSLAISCHGVCAVAATEVAALRQKPLPSPHSALPASFLRHADEQTIVALAAVGQALTQNAIAIGTYRDWGVIAVPRYLGRAALADAIERFRREGAWCISPHLIPHRSLHSLAGTVSQALGIRGPSFGVGGGSGGLAEALMAAAALLAEPSLPGVWLVATGWDPELTPGLSDQAPQPSNAVCLAVVLALVASPAHRHGLGLRLLHNEPRRAADALSLSALAAELAAPPGSAPTCWRLGSGRFIELTRADHTLRNCA